MQNINTILVTGCTRGLGLALVKNLAGQGYQVLAVGRNADVLASLTKEYATVIPVQVDINIPTDRERIVSTVKQLGLPAISLIHNAAISYPERFSELSEAQLRLQVETNYLAPILLTQALIPYLTKQRVLHISSGAATIPLPGLMTYCATKAAMQQTIRCLAAEYAVSDQEIYFGNARPGLLATPLIDEWLAVDTKTLPMVDFYRKAKASGYLIAPELAAEFMSWVLTKTSNQHFQDMDWNIYDASYHDAWLPNDQAAPIAPNF